MRLDYSRGRRCLTENCECRWKDFTSKMSTSSADDSLSPSPVAPNAPKFGTLIPNRIFVGGIAANTTETELHTLFSHFGNVKATKIILDRAGVSKGYGFVTFETEDEARKVQKEADNIILKDRKLNIAPAIKKQPFTRVYEPTPVVPNGTVLCQNGIPYTYHNGVAFFATPENVCTYGSPQTNYPVIYPSSLFLPQQPFQCQTTHTPCGGFSTPAVQEMTQFMPTLTPTHYFLQDRNY